MAHRSPCALKPADNGRSTLLALIALLVGGLFWLVMTLAHWRVPIDVLARLLPVEVAADTFDGEAWLSVAAYRVTGLRVRGLPP